LSTSFVDESNKPMPQKEVKMKPNMESPQTQLMKFIVGKWISKPIYAAAELGIADLLSEGPKNIDQLAAESQTHAPSLYRMMRALASVGIFAETDPKHFKLTPMAELLKSGAMRSTALMFNAEWSDEAWLYFLDSIKTGATAFEKAHGMPVFEWLEENPGPAQVFNEANALKAASSHRAIVDVYDFSGFSKITDVGGGLGSLMIEILIANPSIEGVIADIPSVIEEARQHLQTHGLGKRCQAVECDMFKQIQPGSDAYLLSHILHDWSDEECRAILMNCYRAMIPGNKLLVVEIVIPPGNQPSIGKLLDLEMMVTTGGRERTEEEYETLLESTGFELSRVIPTKASVSIIEGVRK
jgi:hypothetical protein